jgi:hypothetical protein
MGRKMQKKRRNSKIKNRKKGKMKGKKKIGKNIIESLFFSSAYTHSFLENRQSTKCDLRGSESVIIIGNVKYYFQFNWHVRESFSLAKYLRCVQFFNAVVAVTCYMAASCNNCPFRIPAGTPTGLIKHVVSSSFLYP